jgi:hypothetical protein
MLFATIATPNIAFVKQNALWQIVQALHGCRFFIATALQKFHHNVVLL